MVLSARLLMLQNGAVLGQLERLHTNTQQQVRAHTRAHGSSALRVQGRVERG